MAGGSQQAELKLYTLNIKRGVKKRNRAAKTISKAPYFPPPPRKQSTRLSLRPALACMLFMRARRNPGEASGLRVRGWASRAQVQGSEGGSGLGGAGFGFLASACY